jgi:polysaccharide export outer membrane protein
VKNTATDSNKMFRSFLMLTLGLLLMQGCSIPYSRLVNFSSDKPIEYFQAQYIPDPLKIKIQPDDILSVSVSVFDPEAARAFNNTAATRAAPAGGGETGAPGTGPAAGQGYLVDEDGYIEFPVLGKISVMGLTREDAKIQIQNQLLKYLRDPIVEVRFLNMHVSVIGEVRRPGLYTFSDEHFTILEALAMAGDLNDLADRADIMVIRERDKVREFGKVDLTSNLAFESEWFYLTQNDIIYIKPMKEKKAAVRDPLTRISSVGSIVISFSSTIFALIALFTR